MARCCCRGGGAAAAATWRHFVVLPLELLVEGLVVLYLHVLGARDQVLERHAVLGVHHERVARAHVVVRAVVVRW